MTKLVASEMQGGRFW